MIFASFLKANTYSIANDFEVNFLNCFNFKKIMKLIFKYLGLFLLISLAAVSCREDINLFTADTINPPSLGKMVDVDLGGEILNEVGQPVKDVLIEFGNKTTLTDKNGVFIVRNATVSENRAYVTATKSGYFHGSRTMIVQEGKTHYAHIRLLENPVIHSFDSREVGAVQFDNVLLAFPSNSVMLKDGGAYEGEVNVAAKYLNPTDENIAEIMPGDLLGIAETGEEMVLATYGMMAVELTGANGEALQIAEDKEVEMLMTLPDALIGSAPATIPLWYFDEVEGIWKEEGEAVLDGGVYRGVVTHFSFWNCDDPYTLVKMKGQVVDENGNPLPDITVRVEILGATTNNIGYGRTNEDGVFCGKVPKDRDLRLSISQSRLCRNTIIHEEDLGSNSTDFTVSTITIDPTPGTLITADFSGRLVDCDDNPITNGYVRGKFNGYWFNFFVDDTNGTFNQTYTFCDLTSDMEIQGYDLDNNLQTDELTYPIAESVVVGDIKACDQLDEYIRYTLDSDPETIIPGPSGGPDGKTTYINAELDTFLFINFAVDTFNTTGDFPILDSDPTGNMTSSLSVNGLYRNINADVTVTFIRYDEMSGGYIIGTFAGTFEESDGTPHLISDGKFRIKRW